MDISSLKMQEESYESEHVDALGMDMKCETQHSQK